MEITQKEEVQPKLNRQQQRQIDRANEDAQKTFVMLAEKYRVFFMENDPNSEDVTNKQKEVNAKWRIYCKNRSLIPEAFNNMNKYCTELYLQYTTEFTNNDNPSPEPLPSN